MPPRTKSSSGGLRNVLSAIDDMQDMAPGSLVRIERPPESARTRTAWMVAARFEMPPETTYDDVFIIIRDWRDDSTIERKIGSGRLSRIQVTYRNRKGRGSKGEYTLSGMASWELASSRSAERVGVRDDDMESLAERYGSASPRKVSYVESIIVWFSNETAKDISVARKAAKKKKAKGRRRI